MPWSIFTQGGGPGAAASWAQAQLQLDSQQWGTNVDTPGNEQFLYDWELSEGGGGANNPLNQGPVPGAPQLTTTGSQYGGGAADYASLGAGLEGTLAYLDMPLYSGVKTGLEQNNPAAAKAALISSPWASSHYGGGANFASAALPPKTAILTSSGWVNGLKGALGGVGGAILGPVIPSAGGAAAKKAAGAVSGGIGNTIKTAGAYLLFVGAGAALIVAGVAKMANPGQSIKTTIAGATKTAGETAALAAA